MDHKWKGSQPMELFIHKFSKGIITSMLSLWFVSEFVKEVDGGLLTLSNGIGKEYLFDWFSVGLLTLVFYYIAHAAVNFSVKSFVKNPIEIKESKLFGYLIAPVASLTFLFYIGITDKMWILV